MFALLATAFLSMAPTVSHPPVVPATTRWIVELSLSPASPPKAVSESVGRLEHRLA